MTCFKWYCTDFSDALWMGVRFTLSVSAMLFIVQSYQANGNAYVCIILPRAFKQKTCLLGVRSSVYKNNSKKRRKGHRKIERIITAQQRLYKRLNVAEGAKELMGPLIMCLFFHARY